MAEVADGHTYKFNVSMSCGGCSGAVDRVLKKLDGKSPLHCLYACDTSLHTAI